MKQQIIRNFCRPELIAKLLVDYGL
jgi:hypothetical protein